MDRLYLDTSIFGGYFDAEFELWTKILFERIQKGDFQIVISRMVEIELAPAPQHVMDLARMIPKEYMHFVDISDEATTLADQYISENVVGRTSRPDCIHIALATLNHCDVLVSWNFKHIVNVSRIRGYNAVNYKNGHRILDIRSPRELMTYED